MTLATIAQSAYYPSSTSSRVILNRFEKVLDKGKPCEQAGKGFSTIDHIHTVSKLIEVQNAIDVKRGIRQGDTISLKIFTATLENAMRKLEWDDMGVTVDGWQLHYLRFADDIVLITPSISQAERMLTEFDETCGCIGLQLNLQKTMFMRNGWVSDAPFTLNGTNISDCVCQGK
ncbi:hypothetical protein RB195_023924 [Necator americanus]|uniref:Reverse transcriptase domain-containing protein n=1 Tax=Necator americanus TaxID=51031 RepID=A0ABR1ENI3_NECAM